jgi:hypothetical protein
LAYNTASLKCYYRKGATGAATELALATQTVAGAHSDGGFVEIDATNMKGVYRLDLSDTMVLAAPYVTIYLYGATNMAPVVLELEIVAFNPFDSVRLGLTALPNAVPAANGGLPTVDANNRIVGIQGTVNNLTNLDAAISSRLAATSYTAPPVSDITAIKAKTDLNLDAAISSRLAATDYTAPPVADITAIKDQTDQFTFTDSTVDANISADAHAEIATAVWDKNINVKNSAGNLLDAAASYDIGNEVAAVFEEGTPISGTMSRDAALESAATLLDQTVEGAYTLRKLVRGFFSALLGKSSGHVNGSASAPKYRDAADAKNRIDAVTDEHGNRSAVTLDLD